MKEIAKDIFIESNFSGVVVGVIRTLRGLILIDAPFRLEDQHAWREALQNIDGGSNRVLINLDTHIDRTLGVKGMSSVVIAQEKAVSMLKNRPSSSRAQDMDAGAMWEVYEGLSSIRWVSPEITFANRLFLNMDERRVIFEHHSGANVAGVWVKVQHAKVVFVGDSVLINQPPFLADADLDAWLVDLKLLLSSEYRDYLIVSGRDGLVTKDDIREMVKLIKSIQRSLIRLIDKNMDAEGISSLAARMLRRYDSKKAYKETYLNRLRWGISIYYDKQLRPEKDK